MVYYSNSRSDSLVPLGVFLGSMTLLLIGVISLATWYFSSQHRP